MKIDQIRGMSDVDIKISLKDNYEALQNLKFQHSTGQLENYKSLSSIRKDIAKMHTIIKERELKINENLSKNLT